MRFTGVAIPAGATIDTANIVVVSSVGAYDGGATPSGSLKGRKLANCPQITTITDYNDTTTYPRTTANVTWWPTYANWGMNTNRTSPELKTVVQEIVDLSGWASGNAIQIEWHHLLRRGYFINIHDHGVKNFIGTIFKQLQTFSTQKHKLLRLIRFGLN